LFDFFFQITELLPRTFSGKNVRKTLKYIAQGLSLKGEVHSLPASEIKKLCGSEFLGVLMRVA